MKLLSRFNDILDENFLDEPSANEEILSKYPDAEIEILKCYDMIRKAMGYNNEDMFNKEVAKYVSLWKAIYRRYRFDKTGE